VRFKSHNRGAFSRERCAVVLDEIKHGTPHNVTPFKKLDDIALYLASYAKNNHPVGGIEANGRSYTGNVLFPQISHARQSRFLLRVFILVVLGESGGNGKFPLNGSKMVVFMGFRCQCDYQG
jgi:hypothetical protein